MELRTFTKDELEKILADHKAWLIGQGGAKADLSYADLRYADLRYANLSSANLRSADLSSANLSYADLRYADLRYAYLRYAYLRYANLSSANLSSADLSSANLSYADLDFSAFPLWCGGLNTKIDKKIAIQLLYHALAQDCDDKEYQAIRKDKKIIKFLKGFHRLGEIKPYWEKESK